MKILRHGYLSIVELLDMVDTTTGRPSYSKVLGLVSFSSLYLLAMVEIFLPWTRALDWVKWSLIFASPFGVLGLRTWFANKTAQRRDDTADSDPDFYKDDERGEPQWSWDDAPSRIRRAGF